MSVILPAPISELDLHAWADGVLSPERSVLVEDWLRAHPVQAEEVRHWRLQADALRMLYPLPEPETMSASLRRSVERAAAPAEGAPGRPIPCRGAAIAAGLALALSLGVAASLPGASVPDRLSDRALRLHESFLTGPPSSGFASLAGVGSAGPDLSSAGYALQGVRTVAGGGAGYFYEGQGGARLTLLVGRRQDGQPEEFSVIQRGDTALFGWQDQRAAFVLVGAAPSAGLLPVARLVHAGLTRQPPDRAGPNPAEPGSALAVGGSPLSHHRMVPGLLQRCDTGPGLRPSAAGGG